MRVSKDNAIRRKAQRILDWATAEYELARQWIDAAEDEWCGQILGRNDDDEPFARYFERRQRQMAELRATEAYREVSEWRDWLGRVMRAAEQRRHHPLVRLLRRTRHLGHVERNEYGEPGARFHWRWQDLSAESEGRRKLSGSPEAGGMASGMGWPDWSHEGRAWFAWHVLGGPKPLKLEVDWNLGRRAYSLAAEAVLGKGEDGRDILLHVSIPRVLSLYLIAEDVLPEHVRTRWGFSLHPSDGWTLHYAIGKGGDEMSRQRGDPDNWRSGVIFLPDVIFGRFSYETTKEPPVQAIASLPEGDYPLTLTRTTAVRKRPRWPWPAVSYFVDIEASQPPEFAGKGENSYDLGPDAIYGMRSQGHSYERAVGAYVQCTLEERHKWGHLADEHRAILYPATMTGRRE